LIAGRFIAVVVFGDVLGYRDHTVHFVEQVVDGETEVRFVRTQVERERVGQSSSKT
jgi:hypothetical protein